MICPADTSGERPLTHPHLFIEMGLLAAYFSMSCGSMQNAELIRRARSDADHLHALGRLEQIYQAGNQVRAEVA
jgi:hypothetical protein